MQDNETDHGATVARLRDQVKVFEDLLLFLAQHRCPVSFRLTGIATQATELAASHTMPQEHVEDLLRISYEAAALLMEVRAECEEIDRAMMIMLERQALLPDSTNYIFPPARNQ